ncbi:adenylosuccinate lyase [Elysia marginata]|uniref:Adenylosuccinate lyase n=1 Tax=Elysia marginata TaxID=1093978 RepID=A0AAV4GZD1_9GAST|nr:adenylosuccinate lyase [Elysia marginata]
MSLKAISPIDGRYFGQTKVLSSFFSEEALIKYRVFVEIEYFIALCKLPLPQLNNISHRVFNQLRDIASNFSSEDADQIKKIEHITNHDVKAVEYFIKNKFERLGLTPYKEFIHFGLTSQDINNTAIPLSLRDAMLFYYDEVTCLLNTLETLAGQWSKVPMLAKTHGQPASPTCLGKEIKVFTKRIQEQLKSLQTIPICAKFGGATGNFNAHTVAYPNIDWKGFAKNFVARLQLKHSFPTTQIEHYDHLAALFDNLKRINTILIDLDRDFWQYISMAYFNQKIHKNEVGSSAMPHKVNPIDFENSEGNLGIANAIFEHLSGKLPISRLQRDLTDSTVLRNIGVPIAHTLIGIKSTLKGLGKLILNKDKIREDLICNWSVVAEGIQTILRRENYPNPYEVLKALTRKNKVIDQNIVHEFVDKLDISESVKDELKAINPMNYTGVFYK